MKHALALGLLFVATSARADPCTLNPNRATSYSGYSADALVCQGAPLEGVWAKIEGTEIVGISWVDRLEGKSRGVRLERSGWIDFAVVDLYAGGDHAQTREVSRYVFPRTKRMVVEQVGLDFVIHDRAGNAWTVRRRKDRPASVLFVAALNGKPQQLTAMGFTEAGIVGVDLSALSSPLVLYKKEPSMRPQDNRQTSEYENTKSYFVDAKGGRCEVENHLLFGPVKTDPDNKQKTELRFADDRSLAEFLRIHCPKLDRSAL